MYTALFYFTPMYQSITCMISVIYPGKNHVSINFFNSFQNYMKKALGLCDDRLYSKTTPFHGKPSKESLAGLDISFNPYK